MNLGRWVIKSGAILEDGLSRVVLFKGERERVLSACNRCLSFSSLRRSNQRLFQIGRYSLCSL